MSSTGPFQAAIDRINLGCGPHHALEGWLNTDLRAFPGVERVMDATQPWPVPDGSLSYVYGEHFLEHLPILQALDLFTHAGRALRRGGRLRLSTPNLEWVIVTHFSPSGSADDERRRQQTLVVNRAFYGWGHQFLWSRELLQHVLLGMGFEHVEFFAYGESDDPALRDLERHGGYSVADGRPSVVIAEAERGDSEIGVDPDLTDWIRREFVRHVDSGH